MNDLQTQISHAGGNYYNITVRTPDGGEFTTYCSEYEFGSFANLFALGLQPEIAQIIFQPGNKYFDGGCGESVNGLRLIEKTGFGKYFGCDISQIFTDPNRIPNCVFASKTDILSGLIQQPDQEVNTMMFFGIDFTAIQRGNTYVEKVRELVPQKLAPGGHILSFNSPVIVNNFFENEQFTVMDGFGETVTRPSDLMGLIFQKI